MGAAETPAWGGETPGLGETLGMPAERGCNYDLVWRAYRQTDV